MPQWTSWPMDLQPRWRRVAMATEAVPVPSATDPRTGPALAPGPKPAPSLTRRASLNVVASLFDYSAKVAVGFVVVPILVTGLGRSLYGVWEMLGRLVGYMSAGDGRPTQALRPVISNLQASDDDAAKRRYVGGAIVVWLLFLPIVVAAGAGLVWFAPTI